VLVDELIVVNIGVFLGASLRNTPGPVNQGASSSRSTGMWEAVSPHRQLAVLQVVRYWTELIGELGYAAQALPGEHIPHFGEIFGMFCNDDSYLKSRKTWEKL
jgi:hypothetical protein